MRRIVTKVAGQCERCQQEIPRGEAVWWDPATGKILHEECSERTFDGKLTELGRERRREALRTAFNKPDLEVPEKFSLDIGESKERIRERRKKMGWPAEYG